MPSLVDYDPHYRRGERLFGPPLRPWLALLETLDRPIDVLDLGCGQGRNALPAARLGHPVVGVDLAAVGVAQMLADARAEGLTNVTGVVTDALAFRSRRKFDIILLDRVLHLLPSDRERRFLLDRLATLTRTGGSALVTTTRAHRQLLQDHFADHAAWIVVRRQAHWLWMRRLLDRRSPPHTRRARGT